MSGWGTATTVIELNNATTLRARDTIPIGTANSALYPAQGHALISIALEGEKPALDFDAKGEAREGSVRADHAMAGDDEADGVGRIRAADGSGGTV